MTIGLEDFILSLAVSGVCYIQLAKESLSYYGIKNNVTEDDVSELFKGINENFRSIFQRRGLFGKPVELPNSGNDSQQLKALKTAQQRRYELSIIPLILIITTIYDLFWQTRFIDITEYIIYIIFGCYILCKCFFFGRHFEAIVKRRG